ncbi:NAD(P)(+) transhydrogenase (Re/Si-specific) subunit beta [uncultured Anaerococcus sp.]|uniref:NAD(P)(+) transhydrogenase (Re/Si-specific) subunit beta n=1 Tax=uncultured Anaerococcus sp. TaxID=293428 RepID=UPI00260B97B9|nr:NAD(P)(+) transhydrogenase (Re/Si-specific) subunit beta [uncultured Anaerococcus sp.]
MVILGILILVILFGINSMSKVDNAKFGNRLSALAMLVAIIYTIIDADILSQPIIWAAIAVGLIIGYYMAIKVSMIEMPQTVAMLNAFGGLASAIVAMISINMEDKFVAITGILAIFIGVVTFVGSIVAALKLAKKIDGRPIVINGHSTLLNISLIATLIIAILAVMEVISQTTSIILISILSIVFGMLFAIRVGGADMPIVISLLNSTSGVAGSISGMVIFNPLLISVGSIVGASGLILTQIMCKSMNRHLSDILIGSKKKTSENKENIKASKDSKKEALIDKDIEKEEKKSFDYDNLKKVTIVPGYGMALSQAQSKIKELMEALEKQGAEVDFAIHPVAGRMPGHMNVLLAEVDIDYTKFKELEEANASFKDDDLVIVIGANDVVNPAANTAEGTPIYGMPVLNVDEASKVFILNFDKKPGYAGVENPLYEDGNTRLLLGDAKETIGTILDEIRSGKTSQSMIETNNDLSDDSIDYKNLKKVTIVPGYGMALSQAQSKIKELMEALEKQGAEVDFAIHPVAGRMPGHMNVLLAEVDIDYTKFKELEEANASFKDDDLVIVIGANDVVNPAANTAEGTPIYGMPVLNVDEASKVFILNFDKKPGYAGVENPLYEDGNTRLLLGDAKETIGTILDEIRSGKTSQSMIETNNDLSDDSIDYKNLKKVTIVPGYGMALSQAQSKIKELMEALEKQGAEVDFAIHPVAGRMPGHMNVLLAEVDIDYTKFKELEEANASFKDDDLVIVIGANDVVNPAANTAEGTPIYGMPVLNVDEASKVFILNFDKKPGYAGVDNPLYDDGKTRLLLGDAKESIDTILNEINA